MDFGIAGKKAIVAGASAGLGYACAAALAQENADVLISARGETRLLAAADCIRTQTGATITSIVSDHGTAAGRQRLLAACPQPDILVIVGSPPTFGVDYTAISDEDWRTTFESTAIAPIELMRAVAPGMVSRGFGRIVNIATVGAKMPSETRVLSGAPRAALCNYAAALARKVARHNVAINTLVPGFFPTPGMQRAIDFETYEKDRLKRKDDEAFRTPNGMVVPANRHGDPEEIGAFCAMLCSRFAGYVVGQSLVVDGGMIPTMF